MECEKWNVKSEMLLMIRPLKISVDHVSVSVVGHGDHFFNLAEMRQRSEINSAMSSSVFSSVQGTQ